MTITYPCPLCSIDITYIYIPSDLGDRADVDGPENCPACGAPIDLEHVVELTALNAADLCNEDAADD